MSATYFREETDRDMETQDVRFFYGNRLGVASVLPGICINKWQYKIGVYVLFQVGYFVMLNDFANIDTYQGLSAMVGFGVIFCLLWIVEERQLKRSLRKLEEKLQEEHSWKMLLE